MRWRAPTSSRGIEAPYTHQAAAFAAAASGRNAVVVTPTASGKTLCYNLPVLDARSADEILGYDEQGLPRRSWYRHLLYAPGYYTGYGVKTLPGVREAIEDKRYGEVEREVLRVAEALTRETTLLDGIAADLERLIR